MLRLVYTMYVCVYVYTMYYYCVLLLYTTSCTYLLCCMSYNISCCKSVCIFMLLTLPSSLLTVHTLIHTLTHTLYILHIMLRIQAQLRVHTRALSAGRQGLSAGPVRVISLRYILFIYWIFTQYKPVKCHI